MRPRNEDGFAETSLVSRPDGGGDDPVIGREVADRVGAGGVIGELESLAAAAPEVGLAAVASPTSARRSACKAG